MAQILVIDDDPIVRLTLQKALKDQDCKVVVACGGKEGLEKARDIQPDLIVCDWVMPDLDGLSVCTEVKSDPDLAATFFVLLSAKGEVADRVHGLNTGADDFLSKPVDLNEMKAKIRAGLRIRQLSRDLQDQKALLEAELNEAAQYVRSLLPAPLVGTVSVDSRFIPSRELGGDCFDYYWLDPDYLAFYLLDVSGHGLGAALPSISVQNVLRSQSLPDVNFYQPSAVLKALNETFQMNDQNDKYFTIWYGVYNQSRRQLTYASAGHPPAVLINKNEKGFYATCLRTPNLPVGMMTDVTYESDRQVISSESLLYIFSDGVYESFDPSTPLDEDDGIWDLDGFVDLLVQQADSRDLDHLLSTVQGIRRRSTFPDDLSILQVMFA
ncbi:MAG: SpoIIE family protein phosphatase [Cyanobacteria bacterium J06627_8]